MLYTKNKLTTKMWGRFFFLGHVYQHFRCNLAESHLFFGTAFMQSQFYYRQWIGFAFEIFPYFRHISQAIPFRRGGSTSFGKIPTKYAKSLKCQSYKSKLAFCSDTLGSYWADEFCSISVLAKTQNHLITFQFTTFSILMENVFNTKKKIPPIGFSLWKRVFNR